jgi:hypothetical protein
LYQICKLFFQIAAGVYNIGSSVQITSQDASFLTNAITWNATSGQIYVSVDNTSNTLTFTFCGVQFSGTSPIGGGTQTATGQGSFQVSQ